MNHTDNTAQLAPTPAERATRTIFHQTAALVAVLAAFFTHTSAQVKSNLPLQNDAKAAARVCPLKAEVIHTGESVKLLLAAHAGENENRGNVQPTTSDRAT